MTFVLPSINTVLTKSSKRFCKCGEFFRTLMINEDLRGWIEKVKIEEEKRRPSIDKQHSALLEIHSLILKLFYICFGYYPNERRLHEILRESFKTYFVVNDGKWYYIY